MLSLVLRPLSLDASRLGAPTGADGGVLSVMCSVMAFSALLPERSVTMTVKP